MRSVREKRRKSRDKRKDREIEGDRGQEQDTSAVTVNVVCGNKKRKR